MRVASWNYRSRVAGGLALLMLLLLAACSRHEPGRVGGAARLQAKEESRDLNALYQQNYGHRQSGPQPEKLESIQQQKPEVDEQQQQQQQPPSGRMQELLQTEPEQQSGTQASARNENKPTEARKTAYLTFDDGPSASTDKILSILRRYDVKATFFVVGTTSEEGKALYRKISQEGHVLGNHTFSHDYGRVYRSPEAFRQDVDKLNDTLIEATGKRPDILRYPGGSNNKLGRKSGGRWIMPAIIRDMRQRGYQYFDWNVSSTDAAAPVQPRGEIVGAVLGASRGKREAIVLMHDNSRKTTTVEALPTVIEGLRNMGFEFGVLRKTTPAEHFLEAD